MTSAGRALTGLAWPTLLVRSVPLLLGLTDALLVAHLGEDALVATTDGALNTYVLLVLPLGVVTIVSGFSSQYAGAGDLMAARRSAVYGLVIASVTQACAFAVVPRVGQGLTWLMYTPDVRNMLGEYLRVRLGSAGALVGLEVLSCHAFGIGKTVAPIVASAGVLVLNVALALALIDGRAGFPAMGVRGAALASTLATTAAFAGMFVAFLAMGVRGPWSFRELRRLVRAGLPTGVNAFLELAAFAVFINVVVAGFGTTELAAMMVVLQLCSFATLPSFALASAGAILVGRAVGAGDRGRVPALVGLTLRSIAAWQAAVGLAFLVFRGPLLGAFVRGTSNQSLVVAATVPLYLSAVWTLFDAVAATYSEALCAAGDVTFALWARAAVLSLVFVPGTFLLVQRWGAGSTAVIVWFVLCAALMAFLLRRRFARGAWRGMHLTPLRTPAP